jgi:dihydroxy-acid dehydratase
MRERLRSQVARGSVTWAIRRAEWSSLGVSEQDMDKPKIAIVNSSSALAACFAHLDDIAKALRAAIAQAGGLAFEVRTAAPADFITGAGHKGGYILAGRDLVVNDIEVAVEGALLDGMVCLASCDKTVPGQLMAAARLDIPTIVVACGYQPSGSYRGERVDIEDVWLRAAYRAAGKVSMTDEELAEMSEQAILGPGVCAGMGTANSMHIVAEALGMALPGTTPVLANSPSMWRAVEAAAKRIVEMVHEDLTPRRVLTKEAFRNAVCAMLAVAGSINTIKHLQAIAAEARVDVDVYGLFERLGDVVPVLAAIRPNGPQRIEDFEAAGGTLALLRQLEALLATEALTVTGRRVGANLEGVVVRDEETIRPLHQPFSHEPAIVVVRGSLAPGTGIVKRLATGDGDRPRYFRGPARCFDASETAVAAINAGEVRPGEVVVLRGIGPRGTPGMGMASAGVFALDAAGLLGPCALVTDGQQSGLSNLGLVVNEVSPEAATGGPIGLVEDGDVIVIDLQRRVVDRAGDHEELARRRARRDAMAPAETGERGWLSIYQRLVRPLQEGAVLVE